MGEQKHIFFLMNHFFYGLIISFVYGITTSSIVYFLSGAGEFDIYHEIFFSKFKCFISGGIGFGAALLIYKIQDYIPFAIEDAIGTDKLRELDDCRPPLDTYAENKSRYLDPMRSAVFSGQFAIIGFAIFDYAQFPIKGYPEIMLLLYVAAQYAAGVYIGRKIFYIAQMLNSIKSVSVDGGFFKKEKLGGVVLYVNAISTITIIMVYSHVAIYYQSPFLYQSAIGASIKVALLLPAIMAVPVVVLFNFYPRSILKMIYLRSIASEVAQVRVKISDANLAAHERIYYMIEYDKLLRDELKYRLKLNLSDLPVAATIILMLAQLLK